MVTIDLMNSDSILVEENLEKIDDISHQEEMKDFSWYQRPTLQLIMYHWSE